MPTFKACWPADIPHTRLYFHHTRGNGPIWRHDRPSGNTALSLTRLKPLDPKTDGCPVRIGQPFNGKGSGTVTAVSIASAKRLCMGHSPQAGGATPALTLTTSINSPVLAGNGTSIIDATTTGSGSTVDLATAPTMTKLTSEVGTQAQLDGSTKAASTAYVDTAVANAVSGINPAVAVQAATTAAADTSGFTYNNGASGIGATFTQEA